MTQTGQRNHLCNNTICPFLRKGRCSSDSITIGENGVCETWVNRYVADQIKSPKGNWKVIKNKRNPVFKVYINGSTPVIISENKIPDNLKTDELDLSSTNLNSIGQGVEICTLDVAYTKVKEIPDSLKTKSLRACHTPIRSIPNNFEADTLDLASTNITCIPKNLIIRKKLHLGWTPIEELPNDFTIEGSLNLIFSKIKSIPSTMKVWGDLNLTYCEKLKRLPDGFIAERILVLRSSNIKSLPKNLVVKGDLDLRYTKIKSIPECIEVEGDLILDNSMVESLPDTLKVGGKLHAENTKIERYSIRGGVVCKDYLENLDPSILDGVTIKGRFEVPSTWDNLPKNLTVTGTVCMMYNDRIRSIPPDFRAKYLCLEGSEVDDLPPQLNVKGVYIKNDKWLYYLLTEKYPNSNADICIDSYYTARELDDLDDSDGIRIKKDREDRRNKELLLQMYNRSKTNIN